MYTGKIIIHFLFKNNKKIIIKKLCGLAEYRDGFYAYFHVILFVYSSRILKTNIGDLMMCVHGFIIFNRSKIE